jgi:hypothetical protein
MRVFRYVNDRVLLEYTHVLKEQLTPNAISILSTGVEELLAGDIIDNDIEELE